MARTTIAQKPAFPPEYTAADIANFPKARYRLLEAHTTPRLGNRDTDDVWLPGDKETEYMKKGPEDDKDYGTVVGAGTKWPWPIPPTPAMVGLDEMSQALVDKEIARADGLNPVDYLPMTINESVIGDSA